MASEIQPKLHSGGDVGDEEIARNFRTAKNEISTLQTLVSGSVSTTYNGTFSTFEDVQLGRHFEFTWTPADDTDDSVVVADFTTMHVNSSNGDMTGTSHGVASYIRMLIEGGGLIGQAFLNEDRVSIQDGTTIGSLVINKIVIETDAETDGSCSSLILNQLSDFSSTATWTTEILATDYQDPRAIIKTAGAIIVAPGSIGSTTKTMANIDSGKTWTALAGAGVTVTIPANLYPGWKADFVQGDANQITFAAGAGGVLLNKDSHTKTGGLYSVVTVEMIAAGVILLSGQTSA